MIDLHMHTTYSDGQFNVRELLSILNEKGIKYASITDHNSIEAHKEIKENKLKNLYDGKMINGVEIQTIADNFQIEVLVYNFDIDTLDPFISQCQKKYWEFHEKAYKKLLNTAKKLGLKYVEPQKELGGSYYSNTKFQDAINACYSYNKNIIDEKILSDKLHFYRNEFQRKDSIFYIDTNEAFPKLEEVIGEAKKANGIVFIAHIDEYKSITNKIEFLERIIKRYNIDGIECFHPSIDAENRTIYMNICKEHNLLISAGSDFHGEHFSHRRNINTEATLEDINWLENIK